MPEYKGIDVSQWQGNINWAEVKSSGIQFAMIRATYGRGTDVSTDPRLLDNAAGCDTVGLPYGLYHYSYAKTVDEAVEEAKAFLKVIKDLQPQMPVALDLEDSSQAGLPKETLTNIARSFLKMVEAEKYYGILYANYSWLTTRLDMSRLNGIDVWLAQWASKPTYQGNFGMWQYGVIGKNGTKGVDYTIYGQVAGIQGNCDADLAYQDYPQIIRAAGLNHLGSSTEEPESAPEPEPIPEPEPEDGDKWSKIQCILRGLWKYLKLCLSNQWATIKLHFMNFWSSVTRFFENLWASVYHIIQGLFR